LEQNKKLFLFFVTGLGHPRFGTLFSKYGSIKGEKAVFAAPSPNWLTTSV